MKKGNLLIINLKTMKRELFFSKEGFLNGP